MNPEITMEAEQKLKNLGISSLHRTFDPVFYVRIAYNLYELLQCVVVSYSNREFLLNGWQQRSLDCFKLFLYFLYIL